MSELDEALAQITAIHRQMARSAAFRGYGPPTVAATGGLALLAGLVQAKLLPDPAGDVTAYLLLWLGTAAVSLVLTAIEMVTRSHRIHQTLAPEMLAMVVEHLMPSLAVGGLLTLVLWQYDPGNLRMLPGLWQVIYGLGLFASLRFLPKEVFAVGAWYLATGLSILAFDRGPAALGPWIMAGPFAIGQLLLAGILQWRLRDPK